MSVVLDLFFSLYFFCRPLLSCVTNRPLLFLRLRSGTVFQDPSTRDARENNLESTLVVTATAATVAVAVATTTTTTLPNHHPPTLTHADRRCLSTRFSTFFLLPRPLWIVWSEVMARPGNRKLPAASSRINRRWTAGDVRGETLSQRIFDRLPVTNVGCTISSIVFFVLSIISFWNRAIIKCPSTSGNSRSPILVLNNRFLCLRVFYNIQMFYTILY